MTLLADIYDQLQIRYSPVRPNSEFWPECRYVYFICCRKAKAVKIGVASNPLKRLMSMQIGNPLVLSLVALIETPVCDAAAVERCLHKALARRRIRGEWFQLYGEVAELIEYLRDCALNDVGRLEVLNRRPGR